MKRTWWYVADMDDGLLIERRTRSECLTWCKEKSLSDRVLERRRYPGAYEYTIGDSPDDANTWFVCRGDALEDHGFKPDQELMYGDAMHPHEISRDRERRQA